MGKIKKKFGLVLVVGIFVLFILGSIIPNQSRMKIDKTFNNVHNSIAPTELSFYTWGGNESERTYDIAKDSFNNSYLVGETYSFGVGDADLCLVKFNSSGVEWNRTYGGVNRDVGNSIILDSLDNIYITGKTESFGAGESDMWLLKINTTGAVEWNHTWGGNDKEEGKSITLDSSNNVYVAGYTHSFGLGESDMCLVKFNSTGVVWNYTCGGINQDEGYGVATDLLGNYYVVGDTKSFGAGKWDVYLAKFNSSGVVWTQTWGGIEKDHGTDIIINSSNDLYVSGITEGTYPEYDICLVKFNSEGIYQWNSTWEEGYLDYTFGMEIDQSGNVYVAGYTNSDGLADYDICLVKFNSTGVADWYCTWGGSETEVCMGVSLGTNGTAFVGGTTFSYGAGGGDLCLVQFILDQCPVPHPGDNNISIPGYEIILLIGIALMMLIYLIKKEKIHRDNGQNYHS